MAARKSIEELDEQSGGLNAFESRLVNILALLLVQERPQGEQIDLLGRAGFGSAQIAALLGTTRNTVSVELSVRKRGKKSKKKAVKK